MEELNICPYCGRKMELGFIHGDRYILKWVPEKRNKRLAHSLTHHFVNECIDNGCMPQ